MQKKIVVLYDTQIFNIQNYGGISRYFVNLISAIKNSNRFIAKIPILYSTNYYARSLPQWLNNFIGRIWLKRKTKQSKWNLSFAKFLLKNMDYDIFHPTYHNPYFLGALKKPFVITIHDMIYENYPQLFEDSKEIIAQRKKVIESADAIIAISNYTKAQILLHYPHIGDKISVIYHALSNRRTKAANDPLPDKFILYVGDRYALYKNFRPFLKAIAPILIKEKDIKLICAGGGDFNQDEQLELETVGISNLTLQINATDSQLKQLYQQALVFVYPSIEEGFGLPMLEAFRNDCAIACSNTSCLPEVGGDASTYFDPSDIESMRKNVSILLQDPAYRLQQIKKGKERIKLFSFEKCLKETLECYESLLGDR